MIYAEEYDPIQKAIARERQLKRWSAAKKTALVSHDPATLKASADDRQA
jgi:predicted GIY-YIG superfamily endonuclease